jgi:anti-sigma factor RsiW
MSDCASITPFVTPYVDNELPAAERAALERHLTVCGTCHSRVAAEQAVRELLVSRREILRTERPADALRARCAAALRPPLDGATEIGGRPAWYARVGPLAVAASLVLVVAAAFLYQLTVRSSHVMAAELTADHVKCFVLNRLLDPHQSSSVVESTLAASFGWPVRLPSPPGQEGLELLGARPCLYGEGRTAHLMFRHNGQPLSLFMLPDRRRADEMIDVFGHEAVVWSAGNRTFVLVSSEGRAEVERVASFIRSSIR